MLTEINMSDLFWENGVWCFTTPPQVHVNYPAAFLALSNQCLPGRFQHQSCLIYDSITNPITETKKLISIKYILISLAILTLVLVAFAY